MSGRALVNSAKPSNFDYLACKIGFLALTIKEKRSYEKDLTKAVFIGN